jgi:hypothetical protein
MTGIDDFMMLCPGDLDCDGTVGIVDFLRLLDNWNARHRSVTS